jgi:Xaa-Pro dipeptidase
MERFAQYRDVARQLGVDAVGLVPGPNFTRALGQAFGTNERPKLVIIPAQGDPAAIMPNLELRSWDLVDFPGRTFDWMDQTGYDAAFAALAAHLNLKSLAVEGQVMRVFVQQALSAVYPGLHIVDGEREISGLRTIKSDADIAALEGAIRISEAALAETVDQVRAGMTEKQIETLLVRALFSEGADELAFAPIVAAADNSARPHAHARADYAIQPGDALLIDFGAMSGGFCADITRTFFVGHATDEAQDVYATVLAANEKGHEVTKAGITAHEIDDAVTGLLEASPYGDRIRTKTGHGLGRAVHEAPYIMRGNHEVLAAGTVYTNEPGLYRNGGFGVRIEDDILVTQDGCRSLTRFPKELTVVG